MHGFEGEGGEVILPSTLTPYGQGFALCTNDTKFKGYMRVGLS